MSRTDARTDAPARSPGPMTNRSGLDLEVDEPVGVDRADDDLDRRVAAVVDEDLVAAGSAAA